MFFFFEQGNTNCGILASGMGGSGDRERKWEGKFLPTRAKYFVFALNKVKKDQIRLKMVQKG